MKLVAAKCPSCGASLDVNPEQEATKCKYCHQAILVDDAVAKYKLEISGSVEVENLPKQDNILKLANRNYDKKEYDEAYEGYDQLLKLDADNTIALLRYGICKTLLNNYIDFKLDFLSKTFDDVVSLLKKKNEYDKNIDDYIEETLYAVTKSLNATVEFYNSYSINRFDLAQVQEKSFSCLDMYEKLYGYAGEEEKKKIAELIIIAIDFIAKEKTYKTGSGEYGGSITKQFSLDKKERSLLEQKIELYNSVFKPVEKSSPSKNANITDSTTKGSNNSEANNYFYNSNAFIITMISIVGFILPPVGIILVWTWGKNFKQKNKIIATVVMAFWFLLILI